LSILGKTTSSSTFSEKRSQPLVKDKMITSPKRDMNHPFLGSHQLHTITKEGNIFPLGIDAIRFAFFSQH